MTSTEEFAAAVSGQQSPRYVQLLRKIAACRAQIPDLVKTAENTHHKNKYADLTQMIVNLEKPLADNGLMDICDFLPDRNDAGDMVGRYTVIDLETGETHTTFLPMNMADIAQKGAQATGSVSSYFQRYVRSAFWAIPQHDDDGNLAAGISKTRQKSATTRRQTKTAEAAQSSRDSLFEDLKRSLVEATTPDDLDNVGRLIGKLTAEDIDPMQKEELVSMGRELRKELLDRIDALNKRDEQAPPLGDIPL